MHAKFFSKLILKPGWDTLGEASPIASCLRILNSINFQVLVLSNYNSARDSAPMRHAAE